MLCEKCKEEKSVLFGYYGQSLCFPCKKEKVDFNKTLEKRSKSMDISKAKAGDKITYTGLSYSFGGTYRVVSAEETYGAGLCPEDELGKLLIIEFTNRNEPMFIFLEELNKNCWKLEKEVL